MNRQKFRVRVSVEYFASIEAASPAEAVRGLVAFPEGLKPAHDCCQGVEFEGFDSLKVEVQGVRP